jgi:hypothetical protein
MPVRELQLVVPDEGEGCMVHVSNSRDDESCINVTI